MPTLEVLKVHLYNKSTTSFNSFKTKACGLYITIIAQLINKCSENIDLKELNHF